MSDLRTGEKIPLENGVEAEIVKELGRGGQGIVYEVRLNKKPYALKWYFEHKLNARAIYD